MDVANEDTYVGGCHLRGGSKAPFDVTGGGKCTFSENGLFFLQRVFMCGICTHLFSAYLRGKDFVYAPNVGISTSAEEDGLQTGQNTYFGH